MMALRILLISLIFTNFSISSKIKLELSQALGEATTAAQNAAEAAVSAFAQAVATCEVNVSCDQAKSQLIQVRSQMSVVSSAVSRATSAASRANAAAARARSILDAIRNRDSRDAVNAEALLAGFSISSLAQRQAQLAEQATAKAVATCEIIVNVTCQGCPTN